MALFQKLAAEKGDHCLNTRGGPYPLAEGGGGSNTAATPAVIHRKKNTERCSKYLKCTKSSPNKLLFLVRFISVLCHFTQYFHFQKAARVTLLYENHLTNRASLIKGFFSGTVRSSVLSHNRFNDTVQSKLGNNLYSRSNFILLFFNDYIFFFMNSNIHFSTLQKVCKRFQMHSQMSLWHKYTAILQ